MCAIKPSAKLSEIKSAFSVRKLANTPKARKITSTSFLVFSLVSIIYHFSYHRSF